MYSKITRLISVSTIAIFCGVIGASPAIAQTSINVSTDRPDISLTQPTALKTGDNQFEVTVKTASGEPINDAVVSVVLLKHRTATNGWMWKKVKLTPSGSGMYMGSGKVAAKGKWETTIKVKKGGQKIGQKKVTLVAA